VIFSDAGKCVSQESNLLFRFIWSH